MSFDADFAPLEEDRAKLKSFFLLAVILGTIGGSGGGGSGCCSGRWEREGGMEVVGATACFTGFEEGEIGRRPGIGGMEIESE